MLTSGDVIDFELGLPALREAGFRHPEVVVTAQRILDAEPSVVQVVPLTSTGVRKEWRAFIVALAKVNLFDSCELELPNFRIYTTGPSL